MFSSFQSPGLSHPRRSGPVHDVGSVREGEPPPSLTPEETEASNLLRSVRLKVASRDAEAIRRARWTMIDGPAARKVEDTSAPDFNTLPRRARPRIPSEPIPSSAGMGDVTRDFSASPAVPPLPQPFPSAGRSPIPPSMVTVPASPIPPSPMPTSPMPTSPMPASPIPPSPQPLHTGSAAATTPEDIGDVSLAFQRVCWRVC